MRLKLSLVSMATLIATSPALAQTCPTVADPMGLDHGGIEQMELAQFEAQTGTEMVFTQNPDLAALVGRDDLPPVAERLPAEPLVIVPYENCGTYGGEMRYLARALESNTSEGLSWRQVQLVRIDDDQETIIPDVATGWDWNDDYTELTFTLREGHRWSDGHPFTAHDVAFWLNDLINNEELYPTTRSPWNVGARAEIIDDTTVRFVFDAPQPGLLNHLVGQGVFFAAFAPRHALEPFHGDYADNADELAQAAGFDTWADWFRVRWGHWMDRTTHSALGLEVPTLESHIMVEAPDETYRTFVPNPYYHRVDTSGQQLPYVNRHSERFIDPSLYVIEIINGNVDQKSPDGLENYPVLRENEEAGNYRVILPGGNKGPFIVFNQTHEDEAIREIYADPRFRQAMSVAIDRDEVNETLFLGLATLGTSLPYNTPFAEDSDTEHFAQFDPDLANQLLDEMGMERGSDGMRRRPDGETFSIVWEYSTQFAGSPEFPILVAEMWRDVGIDVQLREIDSVTLGERGRDNALDIHMIYDQPIYPVLAAGLEAMVPPFHINDPLTGLPWLEYIETDGASGQEPPQWALDLLALGEEAVTYPPGSEDWNQRLVQMTEIHRDHLPIIGVFAELPRVSIINADLANVPDINWIGNSAAYGYMQPWGVDQWYYSAGQ